MKRALRLACRCLALVLVLAALPGAPQAAEPRFDPFSAVDIEGTLGASLPTDLPFRDASGAEVTLAGLLDERPVVLAPVYYSCPNVCSVTLAGAMTALSAVALEPGRDYRFVAYSIDPREGAAEARKAKAEALTRFRGGADAEAFHFLTGPPESIERLSEAIGFGYAWDPEIQQYAHAAALATVTPEGRLARWLYGLSYQPRDLRLALLEAGRGAIGDAADRLLLLCYRYDPQTGQYSGLVRSLVTGGGAATVVAIAALIGGAFWRERRAGRDRRAQAARGGRRRP